MLYYPNGKGTFFKILLQLFWRSPIFHVRQVFRNAIRAGFWKYGFRSHPSVKCKLLHFWGWWSLNRDMKRDEDCPGWQFWYWELRGMDYNGAGSMGVMPDSDMKKPKQVYLRNYRKFPLIRSAIERVYKDQGKLRSFSPNGETLNA